MKKISVIKFTNTYKIALISFLYFLTSVANAKEYLGFKLSEESAKVHAKLKKDSATFSVDYGYKGHKELPMTKIKYYRRFSKYGRIKKGWLHFTPKQKLYKISVSWADNGKTYKLFRDALESKYGAARYGRGMGFTNVYHYNDGVVSIKLSRNTFGFGDHQTTSLEYIYTPALSDVTDMENKIKQSIKRKNAKKAGNDL